MVDHPWSIVVRWITADYGRLDHGRSRPTPMATLRSPEGCHWSPESGQPYGQLSGQLTTGNSKCNAKDFMGNPKGNPGRNSKGFCHRLSIQINLGVDLSAIFVKETTEVDFENPTALLDDDKSAPKAILDALCTWVVGFWGKIAIRVTSTCQCQHFIKTKIGSRRATIGTDLQHPNTMGTCPPLYL